MRVAKPALLLLTAVTLMACSSVTASDASDAAAFVGTWALRLSGGSGTSYLAEGALTLRSSGKGEIDGSVDVVESQSTGSRRVAGPLTGRSASGSAIDVVAILGTTQREFIGTLAKDSLSGTWLDMDPSGRVTQAGTFRAARQR